MRPSPHTRKLEYMDLVAVKECTDARFLPERFRDSDARRRLESTRIDAVCGRFRLGPPALPAVHCGLRQRLAEWSRLKPDTAPT